MEKDTRKNWEIMLDSVVTVDDLIAWSIMVLHLYSSPGEKEMQDLDADCTLKMANRIEVKLAESILKTYAQFYGAEKLVSDKGKPVTVEYITKRLKKTFDDAKIRCDLLKAAKAVK